MKRFPVFLDRRLLAAAALVVVASVVAGCSATRPVPGTASQSAPAGVTSQKGIAVAGLADSSWPATSAAAALRAVDSSTAIGPAAVAPSSQPTKALVVLRPTPTALLVYPDATLTVTAVTADSEAEERAGDESYLEKVPPDKKMTTFEGVPAYGVEKGVLYGDPGDPSRPYSVGYSTVLVWTVNGHKYSLMSRTLTLSELAAFGANLLPAARK